jgi:hypothetical protein
MRAPGRDAVHRCIQERLDRHRDLIASRIYSSGHGDRQ